MKKILFVMVLFFFATILYGSETPYAAPKPINFRWVTLMSIATLDPAQQNSNPTYAIAPNLYDTLIFPSVQKGYIPWVAESWKISPDGKKYTFFLKKGIRFHDGSEITAEDVAFSMDRLVTLKESTLAPLFRAVKPGTTKVIDNYTVEFNLERPTPEFMVLLYIFKIVNKEVIMKNKAPGSYGEFGDYGLEYLRTNDAGSGPYVADEHKMGNYFRMKRFEAYSLEKWKPNSIDMVTVYTIPEAVTEVTKLKAGELDMGEWTLPAKSLKELQKNENFFVSEENVNGIWYAAMNTTKPPLDDVYVRRAMAHAFNVELVTSQILAGGKRTQGPLPENMRGGCSDIVYYPYDLETAKDLLKQSKYSAEDLKKFEVELAGGISERYNNIFLMFNSDLKKIGLNPKITQTTWPDMTKRQQKPETAFHFALITHVAHVPHPSMLLNFYTKEGWGKATPPGGMYYENPKVTEALETAGRFTDPQEQMKYYCTAQKLIAEDSPAIFSHTDFRLFPMWRYVKGYKYGIGAEYFHLRFNRFTMDIDDPLFQKNHGW